MKPIRILALILCACFVSVAWGQQPVCKAQTWWPEFHRLNMMRWNRCENVLNVTNVRNLSLKWSYATGAPVGSSPAVANGVVYIGSEITTSTRWTPARAPCCGATPAASGDSSPAVANGVVYIGSVDGNVYALNASTGVKLWSYATGKLYIPRLRWRMGSFTSAR